VHKDDIKGDRLLFYISGMVAEFETAINAGWIRMFGRKKVACPLF
jgi:hypothetical protein